MLERIFVPEETFDPVNVIPSRRLPDAIAETVSILPLVVPAALPIEPVKLTAIVPKFDVAPGVENDILVDPLFLISVMRLLASVVIVVLSAGSNQSAGDKSDGSNVFLKSFRAGIMGVVSYVGIL